MTYQNDPDMNRRNFIRNNNRLVWAGGLSVALLLGIVLYSFSNNSATTAGKQPPSSTTTGQGIARTPLTSTSPVATAPPSTTPSTAPPARR